MQHWAGVMGGAQPGLPTAHQKPLFRAGPDQFYRGKGTVALGSAPGGGHHHLPPAKLPVLPSPHWLFCFLTQLRSFFRPSDPHGPWMRLSGSRGKQGVARVVLGPWNSSSSHQQNREVPAESQLEALKGTSGSLPALGFRALSSQRRSCSWQESGWMGALPPGVQGEAAGHVPHLPARRVMLQPKPGWSSPALLLLLPPTGHRARPGAGIVAPIRGGNNSPGLRLPGWTGWSSVTRRPNSPPRSHR